MAARKKARMEKDYLKSSYSGFLDGLLDQEEEEEFIPSKRAWQAQVASAYGFDSSDDDDRESVLTPPKTPPPERKIAKATSRILQKPLYTSAWLAWDIPSTSGHNSGHQPQEIVSNPPSSSTSSASARKNEELRTSRVCKAKRAMKRTHMDAMDPDGYARNKTRTPFRPEDSGESSLSISPQIRNTAKDKRESVPASSNPLLSSTVNDEGHSLSAWDVSPISSGHSTRHQPTMMMATKTVSSSPSNNHKKVGGHLKKKKRFRCPGCHKRFFEKSGMVSHLNTVHLKI